MTVSEIVDTVLSLVFPLLITAGIVITVWAVMRWWHKEP